jgi:hypothetical protein
MLRLSLCLCLSLSLCLFLGLGLMLLLLLLLRDCLCLSMSSQRVHSQRSGCGACRSHTFEQIHRTYLRLGLRLRLRLRLSLRLGLRLGLGLGLRLCLGLSLCLSGSVHPWPPAGRGPRRLSGARCESHEGDVSYTHACARARPTTKHPIVLSPVCGKTGRRSCRCCGAGTRRQQLPLSAVR